MRDRKPQSLGRKSKSADGRRHIKRFLLVLAAADKGGLAGRPRHGAIRMQRDIVDPPTLRLGRERSDIAGCAKAYDLAIIATGDDPRPVGCGAQNAAAMHGNCGGLPFTVRHKDILLGADESRLLAEEIDG